jgi:NOL1/NOP2/fmu family ribosome biogenesis protein
MTTNTTTGKFYEVASKIATLKDDSTLITEKVLVCLQADSFGDAEKKAIEELAPLSYNGTEFGLDNILNINPAQYGEVIEVDDEAAGKWYKAKLSFVTIDEKSMKEKKQNIVYLIQAKDFDHAKSGIAEFMKGSIMDYTITQLTETKIKDVYLCEKI